MAKNFVRWVSLGLTHFKPLFSVYLFNTNTWYRANNFVCWVNLGLTRFKQLFWENLGGPDKDLVIGECCINI